jgi:hypothetical protein
MTRSLAAIALVLAAATSAFAQTLAGEVSVTAGGSSDRVAAAATQARVFGNTDWAAFFGELAWADVAGRTSDAFGAAYPYANRVQVMEAYGERVVHMGPALAGVRAGRFRTPFGIYQSADHAYNGFLRAPMIRYLGYWGLSNTQLEHGVNFVAGIPSLQAEWTIGTPADVGAEPRRSGRDEVIRVQAYRGGLVVGASRIRTQPYQPARYARGRAIFNGVDVRWMHEGVQLRAEWLDGRPFDGMHTRGGYLDTSVHRREMGPVTAVFRIEVLDYDAGARSVFARRATAGARVQVATGLFAQVNGSHQSGALYDQPADAVDAALTYTVRFGK